MRLIVGLMLRVTAVVLMCLAGAAAWVVAEVHQGIREETAASADRVVREAQQLAWRELTWRGSAGRLAKYAFPDWRSSHTLRYISPGNCVALTWEGEATQQQCSGLETAGAPAPRWFETVYREAFGASQPVRRAVILNRKEAGVVVTTPDQGAAVRQVWRQVRVLLAAAAAMAAGIAVLATMVIGVALRPARIITRGLQRLERGDLGARLPPFRAGEFHRIGRAVNALAARLALTTAERTALTQRLFAVQEEERRSLARELHDEFGQCLTATGALASAIQAEAQDRPDVAADARSIGRITGQMMRTLKGALAQLRPPELDDLGLEQSLRRLVSARDRGGARSVRIRLAVDGDLGGVPSATSLAIYRIVQECLTNALRHGVPSEIRVEVSSAAGAIGIRVEDDGGGDPGGIGAGGHGILGIRERIAALGGSLTISRAEAGVRIGATIPVMTPPPAVVPAAQRHVSPVSADLRGLAA